MPDSLTARDVTVRFRAVTALNGFNLAAKAGQVTVLLGPNGAGKSTFIRCCTGLVKPDSGELSVLGHPPGSPEVLPQVGLMPQQTGAWSGIAPRQLLRYLASLYGNPQSPADLMALLGIDRFATTPYRRLSGGQQQAVNLAGALIGRPALIFLDEPTSGLDVRARRQTWDLISQLRTAGVAVVLTTHDMAEAAELADWVYIVDQGRVAVQGKVAELTTAQSLEEVFLANTSGDTL